MTDLFTNEDPGGARAHERAMARLRAQGKDPARVSSREYREALEADLEPTTRQSAHVVSGIAGRSIDVLAHYLLSKRGEEQTSETYSAALSEAQSLYFNAGRS
jgi:hypothetical protein